MDREKSTAVGVLILIAGAIGAMMFRNDSPNSTESGETRLQPSGELAVLDGDSVTTTEAVLPDESTPPTADISSIRNALSSSEPKPKTEPPVEPQPITTKPSSPAPPKMPSFYGGLLKDKHSPTTTNRPVRIPDGTRMRGERKQVVSMTPTRRSTNESDRSEPAKLARPLREFHTVRDGDTLESIAVRHYGDSDWAESIYIANRAQLPSATLLPLRAKLKLPHQRLTAPRFQRPAADYHGQSSSSSSAAPATPRTTLGSVR